MVRSWNGLTATCLSILGTCLVLLAFATKNWIVADGQLENPKIDRIGLWVVCFKNFQDPHHWYDTKFVNCHWVFEEKQYIIHDIIFKNFYSSTQALFSGSVILAVLGLFYTIRYMCFSASVDCLIQILYTLWRLELSSAICGTISLVIFGIHGNSRTWMPQWEHKCVGWSYFVAVVGIIIIYISGILFIIEERSHRIKYRKSTPQTANLYPNQLFDNV